MSAIQIKPSMCIATYKSLDEISWQHVNNSNQGQVVHSHLLSGFHSGMSAIQTEPRRCTATHILDEVDGFSVVNLTISM